MLASFSKKSGVRKFANPLENEPPCKLTKTGNLVCGERSEIHFHARLKYDRSDFSKFFVQKND